MEKTVKQRLVEFIAALNITQAEFQRRCNLSSGYINNMVNGIGAAKLDRILSEYPLLNAKWLLTGEGEMLKPQPTVQQSNFFGDNNYTGGSSNGYPVRAGRCVDLVGGSVRPDIIECPKCNTEIAVPACSSDAVIPLAPSRIVYGPNIRVCEWMRENIELCELIDLAKIFRHATWLQQMESRAMEPRIMENTLLAMRPLDDWRSTPFDGGIYGVDIARPYMIVRRVFDEGERLRCEPFDPKHSAIYIDKAKVFDVCEIIAELKLNKRFRL